MSATPPRFGDLVAADDPARERLLGAHELLIAAGPQPELPPELAHAPAPPGGMVVPFARRRFTAIGAVAIAATVLFGIGYVVGGRDAPRAPGQTITMKGSNGAEATIDVLARDNAGNWPMTFSVSGLPVLPKGSTYTLWLTRDGRLAEQCGAFVVANGKTEVPLNAPYPLKKFDGWVVVKTGTTRPLLTESA
ncbi:MAG: anti-sigma factor [Thermoleophilia bacterium]|nr:anti-sigma factor [Thermoleophilia bacterium]